MAEPSLPDREMRERLLAMLADLIERGGPARLLQEPVVPGPAAFPDAWAPSCAGVALLARRLLWHAGIARTVVIDDHRLDAAPPTERMPATSVELAAVTRDEVRLVLGLVGRDDVAGTLAHEVGIAYALIVPQPAGDPYRHVEAEVATVDSDADLERGSVATVCLGLGVLAANAAFQQYSRGGRFNGAYVPLEYDVLQAGSLPMSALAYLLAVQAVVRAPDGEPPRVPAGLGPPQRDEVSAWIDALVASPGRAALCERLGVAGVPPAPPRPVATPFEDVDLAALDEPAPQRIAFRWHTNRGGLGMLAGAVLGMGFAIVAARGLAPIMAIGSAGCGHAIGRRIRRPRCSGCATIVEPGATTCPHCGAALRGDIAHLSERLDAEERL